MLPFLKLIRIQNLFIVVATQYLMRFAIIAPILAVNKFELQMSELDFFMLVLATVCLTAGGYVINDYFDTKTDSVNKPDSVIVGNKILRRSAMTIHIVFNVIGVIAGFYASWVIGHIKFGFIFILIAGMLWYYSTTYKRQFLIGNLIVAILTAMVPFMVVLYEIPLLNQTYREVLIENNTNLYTVFYWVAAFSFFAFITTLIREIVKDIEDFEGDNAYGRKTLPIVMGVFYTKIVVSVLVLSTMAALLYMYILHLSVSKLTLWYLIIAQLIPFIALLLRLITAKSKKHYSSTSLIVKIIMLSGILYSLIAACIFMHLIESNTFI